MAITQTTHLELNKPDYDAIADIAVLNDNADIIDAMFDGTKIVQTINGESPVGGELPIDVGVTSVNGMTGAVTITQRTVKDLIDIIYPVGTYYETTDNTFNPNTAWTGTTWTKITDGRVLIAGGGDYTVGSNYGEKTHKITTAEMPVHKHTVTTANDGAHTHGAGTLNLTGRFQGGKEGQTGVFSKYSDYGRGLDDSYNGSVVQFSASGHWTGATASAGTHNHAVSVGNTGSGTAMSLVQPSKAVARWLRTA